MERKEFHIGEKRLNNFGSEMIIVNYKKYSNIDVYFPKYNYVVKNREYGRFKDGQIACPYEPRYCGVGYLGEGEYKIKENRKYTKVYNIWTGMLKRCYDKNYIKKYTAYQNKSVCNEWLNFQNFAKWYENNYYEIEDEVMCLDKDILYKGNKIYSPDTCVFVPEKINLLFVKRDKGRGKYPIGVCYDKRSGKFMAQCSTNEFNKNNFLGYYDNPVNAFNSYKQFKESYIKYIAEKYKPYIPKKLYDAMYRYEVEITD